MIFFCLILLGLFTILSYIYEKKIFSPAVVFNGTFCVAVFLYSFRLYGIYPVNDTIFYIISIGSFFFCIGVLFYRGMLSKIYKNVPNVDVIDLSEELKKWDSYYKKYLILLILAVVIEFVYSLPSIIYLLAGNSLYSLRYVEMEYINSLRPTISVVLHSYYAIPIMFVTLPIACIEAFCNRKRLMIVFSGIMSVLFFLAYGERMSFVYFAICLLSTFLIFHKGNMSKKQKRYVIFILSAIVIGIYYTTSLRSTEIGQIDSGFISKIYRYILGSLPNFSQQFENRNITPLYQCGQVSLFGFYNIINTIKEVLTGSSFKFFINADETLSAIRLTKVCIDDSRELYNFSTTGFYYFYADYGWVGIALFSFLLGTISQKVYCSVLRNNDIWHTVVYILFMMMLIMFILYDMFINVQYVLAFIYLVLVFNPKYKIKVKKVKHSSYS